MAEHDPFDPFAPDDDEEVERTVLKPNPGGRRSDPAPAGQPRRAGTGAPIDLSRYTGLNALVTCANPLLLLLPQLRSTVSHPDPAALRESLIRTVKEFEGSARSKSIPQETVLAARYCLSTALDETIMAAPWGANWGANSLLVTFHNDNLGGEKFFSILERALEDPRSNIDLLELLYLCLSFGFQGRYRRTEGGRERLDEWRERAYHAIRQGRGEFERELSPYWKGVVDKRNPLIRIIPLWVVGASALALMVLMYLMFNVRLNRESDPVLHELVTIPGTAFEPKPVLLPPPEDPKLSKFLAPEIAQNLVRVDESARQARVTIIGDGLFGSGSAALSANYQGLIERIGQALKTVPGRVDVVGHTDDRRIISARFPSNWHLSEARAQEVVRLLTQTGVAADRFHAIGRGEAEPLAPNDTPANRARNRRVEIIVFAGVNAPKPATPQANPRQP